MERRERVQRRRELRKTHRSITRRELLVADYVQYKYSDIYAEAVQFYNVLNDLYPTKNDLKKTYEYKAWKKNVRTALNPSSLNIQTPIHPQATHEEQPETSGSTQSLPPSSDRCEQTESQPPSPIHPEKRIYADNLQLRIPLIQYPSVTTETLETVTDIQYPSVTTETLETVTDIQYPSVTTETLETVTEETLAAGTIEPSLLQEISPDAIEKIIEELRAEPDLRDILSAVEEQLEFEQLANDIEIPEYEYDLLEKELENW